MTHSKKLSGTAIGTTFALPYVCIDQVEEKQCEMDPSGTHSQKMQILAPVFCFSFTKNVKMKINQPKIFI